MPTDRRSAEHARSTIVARCDTDMKSRVTRRHFSRALLGGAGLASPFSRAATSPHPEPFSFVLLGDLHFDKLEHHDIDWLQKNHPGDVSQVRNYSRITKEVHPSLFATVRETIANLKAASGTPVPFVIHAGDLVEGLCGTEKLAMQQDAEAVEFVRAANFGVPFLFTKGNHDVTGPGAAGAFKEVLHPFLTKQAASFNAGKLVNDCFAIEHSDAQFCFFDAYDKQSLDWLEATLARRTARRCFVIVHPPVVPYGARSTWHIYSSEQDKPRRERLLELLGRHHAIVLGGHIHKYNLLTRVTPTPRSGKFVQLGISSIISKPAAVTAKDILSGVNEYNDDQIKVEPNFSPATESERRAVYEAEAPFVTEFQYADLPGYAVVTVTSDRVTAKIFSGTSRQLWRTVELAGAI
jgi:hypothetical protein